MRKNSLKFVALLVAVFFCFSMFACDQLNNAPAETANNVDTGASTDQPADQGNDQPADQADDQAADQGSDQPADSAKKVVTVTTSFINDMVKVLAGDLVTRQLIIPAGEDPHLYKPLPEDNQKIQNADLVLYHGLHFEGKMVEALEQYGVNLSERFPEDKIGKMDEDGVEIIDPHFWFDLDLYALACERAAEALITILPEHADEINANLAAYKQELVDVDQWIKSEMDQIPADSRYLITPHDAFNYFSRRYNITVHAPQGVSTDSEVSSADVSETVDLIVEHKVKAIFAESTTDPARMKKLQEDCANKGFEVKVVSGEGQELYSDSLSAEGGEADTFIKMLKHNVNLIVSNLK